MVLLAGALGLGAGTSLTAQAESFIRPGALYVSYTAAGFSGKGGASLAAGNRFGAAKEHEWSLEVIQAPWSWRQPLGTTPGLGTTGDGHSTPLLANYRYYFSPADARVRVYAGASAGVVRSSGDVVVALSGSQRAGSASKTQAAYGAAIGVTGKWSARVSYDLGYRYLQSDGFGVASKLFAGTAGYTGPAGPAIDFPGLSAHQFMFSLKFEF